VLEWLAINDEMGKRDCLDYIKGKGLVPPPETDDEKIRDP
jgi:hypothetical protein